MKTSFTEIQPIPMEPALVQLSWQIVNYLSIGEV